MKKEKQTTQPAVLTDDKGEKILVQGILNKRIFVIGLFMAILAGAMSLTFLTNNSQNQTNTLDWIILAFAVVVLYLCIREILLNRTRSIAVTPSRVFGNTGKEAFDLPFSEIAGAAVKTRNNFLYGTIVYLQMTSKSGKTYVIEQIKNMADVARVLDERTDANA